MSEAHVKAEVGPHRNSLAGDKVFADPFALLAVIWKARLAVVVAAIVAGGAGVLYALMAPSWYRAEVTLLPVDRSAGGGGAALLGQLGGLAALAGVRVGAEAPSESMAVLESREFLREFIQDHQLTKVLVAGLTEQKLEAGTQIAEAEDLRDAVEIFDRRVRSVVESGDDGLVRLRVEWTEPVLAAQWANLLAERINGKLRLRALGESQTSIDFLRREMASTKEIAVQQTIASLLKTEMEKQMIARGNPEFAFRVIDAAEVPKSRISPRRALIVIASASLGGLLAVLIAVGAAVFRGRLSSGLRSTTP
jgi:uncharacterized protein involved in exopolysaccharide biosynthesis